MTVKRKMLIVERTRMSIIARDEIAKIEKDTGIAKTEMTAIAEIVENEMTSVVDQAETGMTVGIEQDPAPVLLIDAEAIVAEVETGRSVSELVMSALQPIDRSPRPSCGNWLKPKSERRKLERTSQHKTRLERKVYQYLEGGTIELVKLLLRPDTDPMIELRVLYH
jgi:hypothetical protein